MHTLFKPLESYLLLFEENVKFTLSKKPPQAIWHYRDDTVFTMWEVSFKVVQDENLKAVELLLVCSFLSNKDIGEDLLS
jgi:hypothetical protein